MRITTYGTRGSSPVARPRTVRYGGNTTCLRVESACLPRGSALLVDGGTGIIPASHDLMAEGVRRILLLMTHYHHDHTQGFPLAPHVFSKDVPLDIYGPREHGVGPRQMLETLMSVPFFPVPFARVASHIACHDMDEIGTDVLLVHPESGAHLVKVDRFEHALAGSGGDDPELPPVAQCLVVRMHKTVHPEYTVSYRFEERPTGRVAVVLTDHENTESLPRDLRRHLAGADLLIQDAQYARAHYDAATAGYGHGTGDYTARVMKECGVGRLGQTHHDPMADDDQVDAIVEEARAWLRAHDAADLAERVFPCADYQQIEV
jgi:ribonuclease BN (tRNA processing enzyme)